MSLEENVNSADPELVNKIFRIIHSLKGASGFLGYDNMTEISHAFETLRANIRESTLSPSAPLINIMLNDIHNCQTVEVTTQVRLLEGFLNPEGVPL